MNAGNRIKQLNEIQTVEDLVSLLKTFGADNIRLSSLNIDYETRAYVDVTHVNLSLTITDDRGTVTADWDSTKSYDHAMGAVE